MARISAKLCQNAFQTILEVSFFDAGKKISAKILDRNLCFSPIWRGFGRATAERTSKSDCWSNFALDRLIERHVRPKNLGFGENLGFVKNFHRIVGDHFSGGIKSLASYFPNIWESSRKNCVCGCNRTSAYLEYGILRKRPKFKICAKIRDFGKISRFSQNFEIFADLRDFRRSSIFSQILEIFADRRDFRRSLRFSQIAEIFVDRPEFRRISRFSQKSEIDVDVVVVVDTTTASTF